MLAHTCNQHAQVCECLGLGWAETIPQQFNNVAVALLTLFEISTTEAWTSVTYAAVDSTSEDMQPIRDNVLARVWFFILFMLVGAYLVLNLFVGVVVDNFKKVCPWGWCSPRVLMFPGRHLRQL